MAYKYLDNAIKAIESQIENAYIQGCSDGKSKAQREYSKHGKTAKIEVLSVGRKLTGEMVIIKCQK